MCVTIIPDMCKIIINKITIDKSMKFCHFRSDFNACQLIDSILILLKIFLNN